MNKKYLLVLLTLTKMSEKVVDFINWFYSKVNNKYVVLLLIHYLFLHYFIYLRIH